jgi:hypothetical protein
MNEASKLRAWWAHRQGLDGSWQGWPAAEVLARAGWARSVGGDGPYLTLFARAGLSREHVDADVANLAIHELPSARGCTYVLPAGDFALGLRAGEGFNTGDLKNAEKLGVPRKEIDRLCDGIVAALEKGPRDPDGIREAVGGKVRNLGPEGQKKGLTTTLPIALGILQQAGEIRRIPVNGRLDQQRYHYALWRPNPLSKLQLSKEQAYTELARRYFQWIGPATLAEFQWFSGLGVKAARAAVEPLQLEPLGTGSDRLLPAEDRSALAVFRPSTEPFYTLASGLDSMLLLRRDVQGLLDPKDAARPVFVDKGLKALGSLADLPSHGIFDRGRVIGLWEYDSFDHSIAWTAFVKKDHALQEAVARTETFVREQLGDARSFSLDSPKSRIPRVEALRKAAG